MRVTAVIASVLLLAACGSTGSATSPATSSANRGAASATGLAGRPDAAHIAAGVAAFKAEFPQLASGRADKGIGNDIDNTCFDIARGEDQSVVLRRVASRFERNGITPDATQAAGIVKMVQTAACPA